MKVALLGKKIGMTQVFDDENRLIPVTVIEAGPCPVTQVKTSDKDGYAAVQIGYRPQKQQRLSKAARGHFKKAGVDTHAELSEFRTDDGAELNVGDILTVDRFEAGQKIDVIGTSKGRGFQGVVKRYGFAGGPASHGSMFHRRGGSYGMCQWPGHVIKGKKMPGHMGDVQRTVQNLTIVKVLADENLILVKGSIPGSRGSLVTVRSAVKNKVAKA
ncbi:MAG: 50S ribosomal protein L3 [Puniceicoccaceae bacterium MED-G30]|jgi:large subunit ribosomal protein L3|nr:MAG: 50S ribosomal protein L3 [Puniceicoccaceae bacterium MED-G30]RPG84158.1 MAG: 50S ribosomal protein L3 [Coraliomargarita sp. TMED73]|tara:strand:- start:1295 stop:1939 length:645 start_codon:yes stop_codon:yes gene_type:complete